MRLVLPWRIRPNSEPNRADLINSCRTWRALESARCGCRLRLPRETLCSRNARIKLEERTRRIRAGEEKLDAAQAQVEELTSQLTHARQEEEQAKASLDVAQRMIDSKMEEAKNSSADQAQAIERSRLAVASAELETQKANSALESLKRENSEREEQIQRLQEELKTERSQARENAEIQDQQTREVQVLKTEASIFRAAWRRLRSEPSEQNFDTRRCKRRWPLSRAERTLQRLRPPLRLRRKNSSIWRSPSCVKSFSAHLPTLRIRRKSSAISKPAWLNQGKAFRRVWRRQVPQRQPATRLSKPASWRSVRHEPNWSRLDRKPRTNERRPSGFKPSSSSCSSSWRLFSRHSPLLNLEVQQR